MENKKNEGSLSADAPELIKRLAAVLSVNQATPVESYNHLANAIKDCLIRGNSKPLDQALESLCKIGREDWLFALRQIAEAESTVCHAVCGNGQQQSIRLFAIPVVLSSGSASAIPVQGSFMGNEAVHQAGLKLNQLATRLGLIDSRSDTCIVPAMFHPAGLQALTYAEVFDVLCDAANGFDDADWICPAYANLSKAECNVYARQLARTEGVAREVRYLIMLTRTDVEAVSATTEAHHFERASPAFNANMNRFMQEATELIQQMLPIDQAAVQVSVLPLSPWYESIAAGKRVIDTIRLADTVRSACQSASVAISDLQIKISPRHSVLPGITIDVCDPSHDVIAQCDFVASGANVMDLLEETYILLKKFGVKRIEVDTALIPPVDGDSGKFASAGKVFQIKAAAQSAMQLHANSMGCRH